MLTEAQKRASKAYDEKRRARGDRKVNFWLTAESLAVLAEKKAKGLSQETAVNAAILASARVVSVPVVEGVLRAEPAKRPKAEPAKVNLSLPPNARLTTPR